MPHRLRRFSSCVIGVFSPAARRDVSCPAAIRSRSAALMIGMAFVGLAANPYAAIALLCLGGFAHQTLSVTVITMASDLFARNEVATVAGIAGLAANLGVLVFTLALGRLVDQIGYGPFFIVLGLLDLIGAALLWTLVRKPA